MRKKKYIQRINHIHTEQIGAADFDIQIEAEIDEAVLHEMMQVDYSALFHKVHQGDQLNAEKFEEVCRDISITSMEFLNTIIDELEAEIQQQLPMIKYVDIEPN